MSNYLTEIDRLAERFRALGNPQRLRIFLRLADCCRATGTCCTTERRCVGDIAGELDIAPSTVSHHLKELRRSGLLHMERNGRTIECWVEPGILGDLSAFFAPEGKESR